MAFYLGSTLAIDSDGYAVVSDPVTTKTFDSSFFRSPEWDSDEHEWWRGEPTNRDLDTTGAWEDIYSNIMVATGGGIIAVGDWRWYNSADKQDGRVDIFDTNGNFIKYLTADDAKIPADDYFNFGHVVAIGNGILAVSNNEMLRGTSPGSAAIHLFDLSGNHIKNIVSAETDVSQYTWGDRNLTIGCGKIVTTDLNWDSSFATGDWVEEGRIHIWDINTEEDSDSTTEIVVSFGDIWRRGITHDGVSRDPSAKTQFGRSVAIGHGRIVVGASGDLKHSSETGDPGAGSVFILDLDGNVLHKIVAPDADPSVSTRMDGFGSSVAIGCGLIAVGAPYRDIGGSNTGSIYVFDLSGKYLYRADQTGGEETAKHSKDVRPNYRVGMHLARMVLDNDKLVYSSIGLTSTGYGDDFLNIIGLDNAAVEDRISESLETYRGDYWGDRNTWDLKNGVLATVTADFTKYGGNHDDSGELWIHKTPLSTSGKINKIITKS